MDQIVPEREPKIFRGLIQSRNRNQKIWMPGAWAGARNLSSGSTALPAGYNIRR